MPDPVPPTPFWLSAFLDFPAAAYDDGVTFWARATGYARSPARGEHDEFATLVPPDGDDFLRVQRTGDPAPRIHLDVHVADPRAAAATAEELGAGVVDDRHGYVVLRSPGGLTFCLVRHPASVRPAPTWWSDGPTSVVDQVCVDVPPARFDAELGFWARLTGWPRRDPDPGSEFGRVEPPRTLPLRILVQRLDDDEPVVRAHLDWSTTDREAEVARHLALGAELVGPGRAWTVLRDPVGMTYCVTEGGPSLEGR